MLIVLIIFIFFFVPPISGQTSPEYDRYFLNGSIINPAIAGSDYYPVVNISYRKQWLNVRNAPSTQMLSTSLRVGRYDFYTPQMLLNKSIKTKERIGLGFNLFNDSNGPLSKTGIHLAYAYHIPIHFDHLAFGMAMSLDQNRLNQNDFDPADPADPEISSGVESVLIPNANIGVYYYGSQFFIGFSVNDLFKYKKLDVKGYNHEDSDYFVTGGYKLRINSFLQIEPSFLLSQVNNQNFKIDLSTKAYINNYNWLAFTYRSTSSAIAMIGISVNKLFNFGYAYEFYFGEITGYYNGSHSFMLGRNIGLRAVDGLRKLNK